MNYEELARTELEEIKKRTQNIIIHMQEVASMQKLRMLQEFNHVLAGFDKQVMALAKKADVENGKVRA